MLIVDGFYPDPMAVREIALRQGFVRYSPPDPHIVGRELGRAAAARPGPWYSSAFVSYHGSACANPFIGARFNPPWLMRNLEEVTGDRAKPETWNDGGDHWNGAFHLIEEGYQPGSGIVHHHHKPGDLEQRGWSGVVYLSPGAPASAGTSVWRDVETGQCTSAYDASYQERRHELALTVENRFNRLVLFRENVLHRVEHGFGQGPDARLTQTLFFEARIPGN